MSAACRSRRIIGKLTGEVFFKAQLLGAKESEGQSYECDVMMPARPAAALEVIETKLLFEFAIVLFDWPAASCGANRRKCSTWTW